MFVSLKIENFNQKSILGKTEEIENYKNVQKKKLINLEKYLMNENNVLNADLIQKNLFPQLEVDVFISHSHKDEDGAIKLAMALEKQGIKAFVDSCVWKNISELLTKINNEFCKDKDGKNYSYSGVMKTTANVHMILSVALQNMIDKSELLIFLDSKNSVPIKDYFNNNDYLHSPWIFSELMFADKVKRRPRKILSTANERLLDSVTASSDIEFQYRLPKLDYLIDFNKFIKWLQKNDYSTNIKTHIDGLTHLDTLYKQISVEPKLLAEPRFK